MARPLDRLGARSLIGGEAFHYLLLQLLFEIWFLPKISLEVQGVLDLLVIETRVVIGESIEYPVEQKPIIVFRQLGHLLFHLMQDAQCAPPARFRAASSSAKRSMTFCSQRVGSPAFSPYSW